MKKGITAGEKISDIRVFRGLIAKSLIEDGFYWASANTNSQSTHSTSVKEFNSVPTLTDILNLSLITDWHERVKIKEDYINQNPDKVYWDYAEYIPYTPRFNSNWVGQRKLIKVSTEGDVYVLGRKGLRKLKAYKNNDINSYVYYKIYDGCYLLHRIVASTFIHTDGNPFLMEVNHDDGIKFNNAKVNLGWMTQGENNKHALENGLKSVKHALLTVVVPNQFEGRQFVLKGSREYTHVITAIGKPNVRHYGCSISEISETESEKFHSGFPDDIFAAYTDNPAYFSSSSKAYLGTVLTGKNAGYQFAIVGNKHALKENCTIGGIIRSIKGERPTHRGCSWKYITLKEAANYPQNAMKEVVS